MKMQIHREYFAYAVIVAMIVSVGTAMLVMTTDVFGSSKKGLLLDVAIENPQGSQDGEINLYQYGEFIQSDYYYILDDYSTAQLEYPKKAVDTGEFEVCVILLRDNLESCANGYNSDSKHPEYVEVTFGSEYQYPSNSNEVSNANANSNTNTAASDSESESSSSQSQSQTVIICAQEKCEIKE